MARLKVLKMREEEMLFLGITRKEVNEQPTDEDDIFNFLSRRHVESDEPKT